MKIRTDLVTNSSSSSFICLKLGDEATINSILKENGLPERESDEMCEAYENNDYSDFDIKADMVVAFGEGSYIHYVGKQLYESDLTDKTLNQLKEEFVDSINQNYDTKVTVDNIDFDYGEYEC